MGGRFSFPVIFDVLNFLEFTEPQGFGLERVNSSYLDSGVRPWIFTTFIGTWMFDVGKTGAFTGVVFMALVVRKILRRVRKQGVFNFSNLVLFVLFYQVVFYGVYYFRQLSANYYVIVMFLLFFYFRLGGDAKLQRRYIKRRYAKK